MYCTWLPEAFICCLTWLALHPFIVMKHLLQHFCFFFYFPSSIHFWECVRVRLWGCGCEGLQAVKPDGRIFRRPLKRTDMCGDGLLWEKEKDREVTEKSRQRTRKISSVNQAWLTASHCWDWWQFSAGESPAHRIHFPSIHLHGGWCPLWVLVPVNQTCQTEAHPHSAIGIMYVQAGCHKKL